MPRPSRARLLAVLLVAVALVAANIAGLLRYPGGPLREPNADGLLWLDHHPDDQGNNWMGFGTAAGVAAGAPIYVGIYPRNQWPWAARVEEVRLINVTEGLQLVEARLARPGTPAPGGVALASGSGPELDDLGLFTDYQRLPADLAGNAPIEDGRMWVEVIANEPGEYSFDSVAIDYRIGPFSFTVVMHQAVSVCLVPLPDGVSCSIDRQ